MSDENPGNKKYAQDGLGRTVLVEAYGEKIENLAEQGYRMLTDEEIAANHEAVRERGTAYGDDGSLLNSTAVRPKARKTDGDGAPTTELEDENADPNAPTWDDVTKADLDKYASKAKIADYPSSATKGEKIAALEKAGKSAADVKG